MHAAGISGLKAYGQIAGERAITAEPGNRLRTAATHVGFGLATDRVKREADIEKPDLAIDGTWTGCATN